MLGKNPGEGRKLVNMSEILTALRSSSSSVEEDRIISHFSSLSDVFVHKLKNRSTIDYLMCMNRVFELNSASVLDLLLLPLKQLYSSGKHPRITAEMQRDKRRNTIDFIYKNICILIHITKAAIQRVMSNLAFSYIE